MKIAGKEKYFSTRKSIVFKALKNMIDLEKITNQTTSENQTFPVTSLASIKNHLI